MNSSPAVMAMGLVVASLSPAAAEEPFEELLGRVPAGANSLMLIDVDAVHASPIAVREGWKDQHKAQYVGGPIILPPEADRLVVAAEMSPARDFSQTWELAVMSLAEPLSLPAVARAEGGYVDEINGHPAVWTPSDAYFVRLEPKQIGVMHPANRQVVSRWIDSVRKRETGIVSPYLKSAAALVNPQTPIVLAFDLEDIVTPHALEEALRESPLAPKDAAGQKAWKDLILGLKGVTLRIQLGEKAQGSLQVDFAESPEVFGKSAKALVLETANQFGAGLEDLESWEALVQSNSILLEGELSKSGMRKMFSLLELPSAKFSALKGETPAPDDAETVAKASQRYYHSVSTLLDDIQKEFQINRDARRGLAPVYLERYGRMIDRLPILNVDQDLLVFGASVSETLRGIASAQRAGGVRAGARKSQTYGANSYSYNSSGYYSGRPIASDRTRIDREEQAKARIVRFNSWKEIQDNQSEIRNKMAEKYGVEF